MMRNQGLKYSIVGALACLLAAVVPISAFTINGSRLTACPRGSVGLSASSTPHSEDLVPSSRRIFLRNVAAVTSAAAITNVAFPAFAEETEPKKSKLKPLDECLYSILRVREASVQETRLIKSGKFKDVQRANVKLAAKFMINNYNLSDNVIAASAYLGNSNRLEASNMGQSAVQSLYTILEYFDSSDVENIKVGGNSMAGKENIVIQGLESVRRDIDGFVDYFPSEVVNTAKAKIAKENELNFKEFDPSLGAILNPNPV